MGDYVPYEERQRRDEEARREAAIDVEQTRRHQVALVTERLASLGGRGTNCFIEVLRPAKGLSWRFRGKTIIHRVGVVGGPRFVIDEVVAAYRVRKGLHRPYRKDGGSMIFDAYVTPDGRVWRFSGEGESENTYQLLLSSVQSLDALSASNLERIAAGLTQVAAK